MKITAKTKLVNVKGCCRLLAEERGLKLTAWTVQKYCREGTWRLGVHWVKRSGEYLINMDAVYEWIVTGQ